MSKSGNRNSFHWRTEKLSKITSYKSSAIRAVDEIMPFKGFWCRMYAQFNLFSDETSTKDSTVRAFSNSPESVEFCREYKVKACFLKFWHYQGPPDAHQSSSYLLPQYKWTLRKNYCHFHQEGNRKHRSLEYFLH